MAKNPKMVICRNCKNPMSENAKICPSCGVKNSKPLYKKAWFIILVIIVVIGMIASIGGGSGKIARVAWDAAIDAISETIGSLLGGGEKITWNNIILGERLPEPPTNRGRIHTNSAGDLWIAISALSSVQFNDYIEACKEKGYTVDAEYDSSSYEAYNAEGYSLRLSHYGNEADMSIRLEAPMQLGTITWPNSTAGNKLPTPKSTTGKFSYEHDDSFFVYVGGMTRDDYNEYVNACSEKGFNVDYDKGDIYYRANDAEGWHISLAYEGNSIMTIKIYASNKEVPERQTKETNKPKETSKPDKTTKPQKTTKPTNTSNASGIGSDFKAAMDSYEKFMNEYVAFMKKYSANPSDLGLLADYAKFMMDYANFVADFEKWGDAELNTKETKYYIEVQNRVNQKLLDIAI